MGRLAADGLTAGERELIYGHAARQAAHAAEHIRYCARRDPGRAADAAWTTADALHTAARVTNNRALCGHDHARPGRTSPGQPPCPLQPVACRNARRRRNDPRAHYERERDSRN
jgi:hypothetical protein